jgi:hypothetical protein
MHGTNVNRRDIYQKAFSLRRPALYSFLLVIAFTLFAPALASPSVEPNSITGEDTSNKQTAPVVDLMLGSSTQGRPIDAVRIGDGPRKLVVVGATHGWPERSTYDLALQLAAYFRANPADVPHGVRLYIIPLLNPDGLALGTRQNANGVDLNRNMDTSADSCPANDWQQQTAGAYGVIGDIGGPYPESEVESRLLRDFLLDADGAVFLHAAGGVVFPPCRHPPSDVMAGIYATNSGYLYIPEWTNYQITGGMHDWAAGLGIAAITPELFSEAFPDTEQNLAGLLAVLQAFEEIVLAPEPRIEGGVEVHPIIWRAWKAWGGEGLFGLPLGPVTQTGDGWTQIFERAIFEYKPDQSDTTAVVQLGKVAHHVVGEQISAPTVQPAMSDLFAQFWQINGGQAILGAPFGPEEQATDARGMPVVRQHFERAILERPVDAFDLAQVSLAPLGRLRWAQLDGQSPKTSIVAR